MQPITIVVLLLLLLLLLVHCSTANREHSQLCTL
jgi:hypothetical protein